MNIELVDILQSSDNICRKYIYKINQYLISAVFINHKNNILCIPTSIGCNVGCKICYAGNTRQLIMFLTCNQMKYIIDTILSNEKEIINNNKKCMLLSAMGTGEPLYNIKNLVNTFKNYESINSKFALSTTVPSLNLLETLYRDLMENNFKVKLQISLHAPYDDLRKRILSQNLVEIKSVVSVLNNFNKVYPLDIEWNYCLLAGINDDLHYANELKLILPPKSVIKLNKFNTWEGVKFKESSQEKISQFSNALLKVGLIPEIYETNGSDINGACGQNY